MKTPDISEPQRIDIASLFNRDLDVKEICEIYTDLTELQVRRALEKMGYSTKGR